MIGIIIISESKASAEMLSTVKNVLGRKNVCGMQALSIKSNFSRTTLEGKVNKALRKIGKTDGTIILSEVYGSTQSNICNDFLHADMIEMISGYNLPMLIKAATLNQKTSLRHLVKALCDTGKKYIRCFQC